MEKEIKVGSPVVVMGVVSSIDLNESVDYPIKVLLDEYSGTVLSFTRDGRYISLDKKRSLFSVSEFEDGELVEAYVDVTDEWARCTFICETKDRRFICGNYGHYQFGYDKRGLFVYDKIRKIKKVDPVEKEIEDAISVLERYGRIQDGKILKQG